MWNNWLPTETFLDILLGKWSGQQFLVVLCFSHSAQKLHADMMLALRFSFIYLTGAAAYVTGRGANITVVFLFEWSVHPTEMQKELVLIQNSIICKNVYRAWPNVWTNLWFSRTQKWSTCSSKRRSSLDAFSLKRCMCLLLNCIQEGWTTVFRYSATLVKPQYCRLLH